MTIGEIKLHIKTYNEQKKDEAKAQLATNYNLAVMVAQFVNTSLNGKKLPSIEELYPETFTGKKSLAKQQAEVMDVDYERAMAQRDLWFAFAQRHNEKIRRNQQGKVN